MFWIIVFSLASSELSNQLIFDISIMVLELLALGREILGDLEGKVGGTSAGYNSREFTFPSSHFLLGNCHLEISCHSGRSTGPALRLTTIYGTLNILEFYLFMSFLKYNFSKMAQTFYTAEVEIPSISHGGKEGYLSRTGFGIK